MEITKNQIEKSYELEEKKGLISRLNNVYDQIPGGTCNGCTKCCMESVNTFYIEFLNIYKYIQNIDGLMEKWIKHIEEHFFNELIEKSSCPFLDEDGKCIIYPVRPLVCRLFGYATKEEHEANYERVFNMNIDAKEYFEEEYDVSLADDVVNHKIEYCNSFEVGRVISIEERNRFVDKMFEMDSEFLMEELISEDLINISLTNWFIYTKYSEEEASEERINRLLNTKNR